MSGDPIISKLEEIQNEEVIRVKTFCVDIKEKLLGAFVSDKRKLIIDWCKTNPCENSKQIHRFLITYPNLYYYEQTSDPKMLEAKTDLFTMDEELEREKVGIEKEEIPVLLTVQLKSGVDAYSKVFVF